jgi:hypothetical protein
MMVEFEARNKVGLLVIAKETTRGCGSSLVVIIPLGLLRASIKPNFRIRNYLVFFLASMRDFLAFMTNMWQEVVGGALLSKGIESLSPNPTNVNVTSTTTHIPSPLPDSPLQPKYSHTDIF